MTPLDALVPQDKRYHVPKKGSVSRGGWGVIVVSSLLVTAMLFSPLPPMVVTPIVLLTLAAYIGLFFRKTIRLNRTNTDAVQALTSGRVDDAVQLLEPAIGRAGGADMIKAFLVYNRGIAHYYSGEPHLAIPLIASSIRSRWFTSRQLSGFQSVTLSVFARVHATLGDLEAAAFWQDRARAEVTPERRYFLVLTDALMLARRERFAEVDQLLNDTWADVEGIAQSPERKALRLLWAFAKSRGSAAVDGPEIQELIAGCKPYRAGEFRYLANHWPAFGSWLEERGLA